MLIATTSFKVWVDEGIQRIWVTAINNNDQYAEKSSLKQISQVIYQFM